MSPYRIFAAATAGVSALILVLTQVVGGAEESAAPEIEPLPTVAPSPIVAPSPTATSQPSPEVTEEPEPPEVGTIVYEHDFSSPENGLLEGQSEDSATNQFGSRFAEYTDAGTLLVVAESTLQTYVGGANTEGMVVAGRDLADLGDVSIEVDADPVDLGEGGGWGLACRRDREVGRFYFAALLDAEGRQGAFIARQDSPGTGWEGVAIEPSLPAGVTISPGNPNRLRLDCIGSTISLYVDGQKVVEGADSTYDSGSIALFVNPRSTEAVSAAVEFDNLVIREAG
ncbi:MAG: hypothetical protein ACRDHM_02035 [Actinomycetota bacterium]